MSAHGGAAVAAICAAFYQNIWIWMLLLGAALAAEPLAAGATAQCQNAKCGGVDIPYPFVMNSSSCPMVPAFEVSCNDMGNGVYKPFVGDVELLSIDVQHGQARVRNHISYACYNNSTRQIDSNVWELNLTGTGYRISDSANKFTVIGCRTLAYIADQDYVGKYMSGCVSVCRRGELIGVTNNTCSGKGCCQTAIPEGLDYYQVWFEESMNTSGIYNQTPCNYAVLMEASNFSFSTTYLTSPFEFNNTYGGKAPVVLDWTIQTANTCKEAEVNLESYACKSDNVKCINSFDRTGYICSCQDGYQGNPYLQGPNGCQDINECQHGESYPCYGDCYNKPGSFDCLCHAGSSGNATIQGGCRKDLLSPKTRLAIGVVASVLAVLFGFLGWEVIRHKQKIKRQALLRQTDEFFQQHGGQILLEIMKADGNDGFTLYKRGEIETATNNFSKAHVIGEGGQGTVYKAVIDGVAVAIKKCKEIDESRKMEFVQELVILCRVSHPNIVKLLGCCLQFEAPMLVYEFVQNKTLQELLDLQRSRRFHVTLGTRLRIAAESADALSHLHSLPHPILHGDVKTANILLANGLVAKVSDFGCSTIDERTQAVPKGTPGYIDPDYLVEYQLTTRNDVYSFGVILLELLTGRRPLSKERKSLTLVFQEARSNGTLIELLDSDIVDETSMRVIKRAANLVSHCLVVPGTTRPSMTIVAAELRRLAEADEVKRSPQPPLVLEDLRFMDMGSTTNTLYGESRTSGAYSLEKKAVLSIDEQTILRLTIAFAAAALLAGGAEAQCQHSCGGIDIPYPFGIGSGDDCALPGYEIVCNNSRPFYVDVEVLSISLQLGQMRVMTGISSSCYNTTSRKMDSTAWSFNLSAVPFMLSDSNKFTFVGCRSLAYISDPMSNYTSGCASSCPGATVVSATNGTCTGIGCCQTTIPRELEYYEAPLMLDWGIWDTQDCVEAQKNLTSYACKSNHSVCLNYSNGVESAYMCNCLKGYQGNPYIQDGCQDIDECEHPESYSCYGECHNKDGGFDCFCHAVTRGNAYISGGCQLDFLEHPQW
uniref:Protein kinase domain-containing protein n=1 Tax=Oryza nivara TaxID=4536 RepID=A0A0E0GZQ3_ORYNI